MIFRILIFATLFGLTNSLSAAVDFDRDVATILIKRCIECHDSKQKKGGLDLTTQDSLKLGGESGSVVTPGSASTSVLIDLIDSGLMPPPAKGMTQKLPAAEIEVLVRWINQSVVWPAGRKLDLYERTTDIRGGRDWWSFQPLLAAEPPIPLTDHRVSNMVDSFVLAKLTEHGFTMAEPATKQVLIRRLYFDLTGLPPNPVAIDDFVNSQEANAYERLVDQLLASTHFGERWARHWLDLIRFAETCGYERDQLKPNIWKYRDWVISAFNDDMPYDRFITDQLAGDEVPYRDEESIVATGMIRAGTWNDEPNDPADYQYTRLEDMVHTTSSAFIGLTVKCARCHDHKFDPIRQTDYYKFANAFWSGFVGQSNLGGPSEKELGSTAFGWTDRSREVAPLHLLINGERGKPAELVAPASISTLPRLERVYKTAPQESNTTTQRLQLAHWLTDKEHPLTSRVIVNRLWQHTMGEGIVRTPNNFGFKGALPTHPKLLDYLASKLRRDGWSMKSIIKLIVMSNTYRQASVNVNQLEYSQTDSLNTTWWRANRKRLDAEQLRDAILATSGQLNLKLGGPSFFPQMSPEALEGLSKKAGAWGTSPLSERNRRSIYMMTKRSRLLPLMTTFNFTDTTLPCGQRDVTTVAPQALALLNNQFVHLQSAAFADRLFTLHPDDFDEQIKSAWLLAIGRPASDLEVNASKQHVLEQQDYFNNTVQLGAERTDALSVKGGLSVWLDATQRLELDADKRVISWGDSSGSSLDGQQPIDAVQGEPTIRPSYVSNGLNGKPAIRFNGKNQYLKLTAPPLSKQAFTIIAVARDASDDNRHHEIFSNWNSRGRSVNSLFLGTTGNGTIRLSDAFNSAGQIPDRNIPFILTGFNSDKSSNTYLNGAELASSIPLKGRVLAGPYVIGTQGNINGEYWLGDIAELLVYERALSRTELNQVWSYLSLKYSIALKTDSKSPRRLALASLCHVLLNTNEFIYID
ncbi:MAG: hypothetical protein CMJ76_16105 [Planctomycetaceae bacterium]|nr:hypothetical protein [Planctomycetaceae bacterium]